MVGGGLRFVIDDEDSVELGFAAGDPVEGGHDLREIHRLDKIGAAPGPNGLQTRSTSDRFETITTGTSGSEDLPEPWRPLCAVLFSDG